MGGKGPSDLRSWVALSRTRYDLLTQTLNAGSTAFLLQAKTGSLGPSSALDLFSAEIGGKLQKAIQSSAAMRSSRVESGQEGQSSPIRSKVQLQCPSKESLPDQR